MVGCDDDGGRLRRQGAADAGQTPRGSVWLFAGIIIISSFTAAIASALTASERATQVRGPGDLPNVRRYRTASTSASYLRSQRLGFREYGHLEAVLQAVADGEVDALVYDAPILCYLNRL